MQRVVGEVTSMKPMQLLLGLVLSACAGDVDGPSPDPAEDAVTDSEVVGVLATASIGQVVLADEFEDMLTSPEAHNFAAKMMSLHNTLLAELDQLVEDMGMLYDRQNPISLQIEFEVEKEYADILVAENPDLRYLCGQVFLHRDIVGVMDRTLRDEAKDPQVRAQVEKRREIMRGSLAAARNNVELLTGDDFESACADQR
jgi:predicted outer membrane protein